MKGIVKRYGLKKGYGFIRTKDGHDIFVHHSDVMTTGRPKIVEVGSIVEFDPVKVERGIQAKNVRIKHMLNEVSQERR